MPKEACVGGQLWEQYAKKVRDRMDKPTHRGRISEEEAKALDCELLAVTWGAEACGDAVELYWAVHRATDTVRLARFFSFGCGTAIASSDYTCELCEGKTLDEILKITNVIVEHGLRDAPDVPAVPPQKMHCSVMAQDVLRKAVATYRGVDMSSLEDQEIVCSCARVTVGTVREAIRNNDLTTVEQITQYTKAGAFCKSCVRPGGHEKRDIYLEDILRDTRAEMAKERIAKAKAAPAARSDFQGMNIIRKGNVIQDNIDKNVIPILEKDGGSADVVDVRDGEDGVTTVYIEYSGACVGCKSSSTTTLNMIQEVLRSNISPNIKVIPTN